VSGFKKFCEKKKKKKDARIHKANRSYLRLFAAFFFTTFLFAIRYHLSVNGPYGGPSLK